ncbi:MATE family efflux transporter [Qiania dongpingensis]|uniref:Probable multidrug resistance protein NorM n=1 Tax=Qiania dongpingensis TaxID=2763669 RepID=A0A7G9G6A5_9FIRM|nr:MATE family efflux transporter [Qiania dongpingensis]QNM06337.1 MATE family efflux transporter [Qiania dongpingensis]
MEKEVTMNRMGTAPIKKLMLTMGIPMILSMALQALYNIVDSFFVSSIKDTPTVAHLGDYAVNALTLAFPVQMLMVAIGIGTGVGVNALLSKSLGQGDREKGSWISGNAVFLGLCTYIVFLLFGIFGVNAYMISQTKNPVVLQMGKAYLGICSILSFGSILFMIYEKLLQATGRTMLSTVAQVAGAVTNIILDPILIFGYLGFPEMGIEGAAYATVIGQVISLVLGILFHMICNRRDINTDFQYLRPRKKIITEVYTIGIPAIIMQAMMSFMTYGVNIIFGAVSTAAVTAYGIYYKIQQFVFFAAFGMNNAMIPIIGFNYGKRDEKRIHEGIRYGMVYTLIIMLVGAILLQLFAGQLIGIFSLSDETRALCIRAARIITLGYLFAGANIAYQGVFQALGNGVRSLLVSMVRLIIVALPLAWIFTRLPNAETLIWTAFPIAEGAALILAAVLMRRVAKKRFA